MPHQSAQNHWVTLIYFVVLAGVSAVFYGSTDSYIVGSPRLHNQLPQDVANEAELFEIMAQDLRVKGYTIQPNAIPDHLAHALLHQLESLGDEDFQKAAIGRGRQAGTNLFIRQNKISWIEEDHPDSATWLQWASRLQNYLNRTLFLGLFSFESHFTFYEKGGRYKRHLDAFRGERNRIISLVTYLNEGWLPDQGGELVLYPEGTDPIHVTPAFGTVVLFLSEELPHEVMPTERLRHGVAGWFRLNTSIHQQIDPPR